MEGTDVKKIIAELTVKERAAESQLGDLRRAIKAIQVVCPHHWLDQGYDPRGGGTQHDKCSWCGLERRS